MSSIGIVAARIGAWRKSALRALLLAGCILAPTQGQAQDESALGLPTHEVGDTYVYDIDGSIVPEIVRQGVAGHYVWELGGKGVELRYADPTVPPERKVTPSGEEVVRRIYTHSAHSYFPLRAGSEIQYTADIRTKLEPDPARERHRCRATEWQDTTVKAGTFRTLEVSCVRRDYKSLHYYAPEIEAVVLELRTPTYEFRRRELVAFRPAGSAEVEVEVEQIAEETDLTPTDTEVPIELTPVADLKEWGVQVAAFWDYPRVARFLAEFERKYPDGFEGYNPIVYEFDLEDGRGPFTRIIAASFDTKAEATLLCRKLLADRTDCWVHTIP